MNIEKLTSELDDYCDFGEDEVYVLMAIARAKENEEFSNNSEPVIREVVEDFGQLERKMEQLDHAVSRFDSDFRLYISANARDVMKAFFKFRSDTDNWLEMRLNGNKDVNKKFKGLDSEFKSVLQSDKCKAETNFIFDLDNIEKIQMQELKAELGEHTSVRWARETPNGYHIVTRPFNYNELDSGIDYELKTDGMIFLSYIGR